MTQAQVKQGQLPDFSLKVSLPLQVKEEPSISDIHPSRGLGNGNSESLYDSLKCCSVCEIAAQDA